MTIWAAEAPDRYATVASITQREAAVPENEGRGDFWPRGEGGAGWASGGGEAALEGRRKSSEAAARSSASAAPVAGTRQCARNAQGTAADRAIGGRLALGKIVAKDDEPVGAARRVVAPGAPFTFYTLSRLRSWLVSCVRCGGPTHSQPSASGSCDQHKQCCVL